ncbi:hypothetical protein HMPREF1414_01189 [Helicobacter pylori GAM252T]|nr:hypothetical protein HMPREF1414_01189 [Helicobacter pylori GAM252T]EMH13867.1 hypothetical protein HMPREF1412_00889 [Helicobacter pylori GAM250T]EMH14132.1 hypothetical protein HMPREF1413_01126 [Helicobacter pylori GAM252Bi]EMH45610.1 hypothetical protein HMPREF1438_01580 [Helicobacter pylori HP250AFii]EMH46140.1 hypothetical protein HMPREF1439_01542 [Helicobacter pylori HP250AFiii]EMH51644.1 hypothetical protein HMPREF1442_01346 [Helicobacter pylori HP250ASii]EMH52865.1 hypothetical prote
MKANPLFRGWFANTLPPIILFKPIAPHAKSMGLRVILRLVLETIPHS